jgi:hypothetical protein
MFTIKLGNYEKQLSFIEICQALHRPGYFIWLSNNVDKCFNEDFKSSNNGLVHEKTPFISFVTNN